MNKQFTADKSSTDVKRKKNSQLKIPFYNLNQEKKLEYAVLFSILLFVIKLIFPLNNAVVPLIIGELLILLVIHTWTLYATGYIRIKTSSPLSIILNSGILTAIIFFLITVTSFLFDIESVKTVSSNFLYTIFTILVVFVFIASLTYIFTTFRELFFLRQKRDPRVYFNSMIIFFILAAFAASLSSKVEGTNYIENTFFVVSLVLIGTNSIRVSWIAFLNKKQKVYLLGVSVVLEILFVLNTVSTYDEGSLNLVLILYNFSPALFMFFRLMMFYGAIYFGVIFFTTLFHLPTAEEFDRKAEEVTSLINLNKLMTQVFDFKDLAETVTGLTAKISNSDTAWLVTNLGDNYEISSIKNIGYVEAEKITNYLLSNNEGNLEEVSSISQKQLRELDRDEEFHYSFKSIVAAPLKVHQNINGYLFAARKGEYPFDEEDKKSIVAFADYAAIALENAKLIKESLEKERLEKEMEVAREIQYKILPLKTPEFPKLEISSLFVPAFEVGGDYYDFFDLGDGKLGFVIADVSGKGISAAFIMAEVKGIFESLSQMFSSSKELLNKVNDTLKGSLDKKDFVTAIYGIIDNNNNSLNYARAGHTQLMFIRDKQVDLLKPAGMGLGLDFTGNFFDSMVEEEIELKENDMLVLYTDGIPESQNHNNEEFGYERFKEEILTNIDSDLESISNSIMKKVTVYSKDNSQHDDITLVIFRYLNNKKSIGVS